MAFDIFSLVENKCCSIPKWKFDLGLGMYTIDYGPNNSQYPNKRISVVTTNNLF